MSSSDLFTADYPHGTPEGYDGPDGHDGCRGGACPGGAMWGLTCKDAKRLSRGDYRYQQLVKRGLTPAEIADELGLIPTSPTAAPVKKPSKATNYSPARAAGEERAAQLRADLDARTAAKKAAKAEAAAAFATDEELLDNDPDTNLSDQHAAVYAEVMDDSVGLQEQIQTFMPQIEPGVAAYLGRPGELTAISLDVQGVGNSDENSAPTIAPTPKEIRTWAIDRGYEVKPTGKLPQHIIDHYWETHGLLDRPAYYAPAKPDTSTAADDDTADAGTIVPEPAGRRPEWSHVTLTEDLARAQTDRDALAEELAEAQGELTRARGLAARLEEELARDRDKHAAEISDLNGQLSASHHDTLQRIAQLEESLTLLEQDERIRAWELVASHRAFAGCSAEDAPLLTSILKRLNELTNQDQAATIASLSRALEFTIRQWAIERDRNQRHDEQLEAFREEWEKAITRPTTIDHTAFAAAGFGQRIADVAATPTPEPEEPTLTTRLRGWMTGR